MNKRPMNKRRMWFYFILAAIYTTVATVHGESGGYSWQVWVFTGFAILFLVGALREVSKWVDEADHEDR